MTAFTIDQLVIPATIDAPDAGDFIAMTHIRNVVEADAIGSRGHTYEPSERLPFWQNPYVPLTSFVARVDGQVVAWAVYEAPIADGSTHVLFEIEVLPSFRSMGIGSALFDRLNALCESDGRTTQQAFVMHKTAGGSETLRSPTGFGSVPLANPETRFLLHRGFRLEQVERVSRLDLPMEAVSFAASLAAAAEAVGSDYRLTNWAGRTPEKWVSGMALLYQRMSTDAPMAELESAEEHWDDARVHTLDELRATSPRTMLVTAAEHVATGVLAGFTELYVPPETERSVEQQNTLVLKEHRGHRLGLLLKLANLHLLAETHSGHPSVTTLNAEDNRPMLDVNEEIGFVPVAYGGGWKRELSR